MITHSSSIQFFDFSVSKGWGVLMQKMIVLALLVMLNYQKHLVSICIDTFMKSVDSIDTRIDTCAIQH